MSWVAAGVSVAAYELSKATAKKAAPAVAVQSPPPAPVAVGNSGEAFPNPAPDFWKQNASDAYRKTN